MLAANVPGRIALPFANGAAVGYKNPIPVASQIGITPGAASYTDGFPPVCFLPLVAGGIAPAGADFNGLLNAITAVQQWQSAGGLFHYDSAFSTAIGGYPAGAMIISTSNTTTWLNLSDNNTTNPDATDGSAANWAPVDAYGIATVTGLTNASVTLLPAQWSKPVIVLTGTLTANINIIFPTTLQEWLVVNNTTGAFIVTCKTSAGTGAPVAQGGGQQTFWGDGTNLNPLAGNSAVPLVVGTATAPTHAMNQAAGDARYAVIGGNGGRLINTIYYSVVNQNITVSIASPAVVTYAAADKLPQANAPIVFATTGALPTGLVAGTTYYVKSPSGTTSQLSATPGGAAINTTGSQSGTHSAANPAYLKATNNPSFVITEEWGGGGGGGGSNATGAGGGGSGGYSRQKILAAALLTSETITVGVGGAAGSSAAGNGGTGGTSSFGSHSSSTGGQGGIAGGGVGGVGGIGVGGDLNLTGSPGGPASLASGGGGAGFGGASQLGGNGLGSYVQVSYPGANAANNSASGGGGGDALNSTVQVGGVGGSGLAIVYEYA